MPSWWIVKETWFSVGSQLTQSNTTKPIKGNEGMCAFLYCVWMYRAAEKNNSSYIWWTLGSWCDRNKDCCHLRVSCTHTKPRSTLSAQKCQSGRLTAQRVPLHTPVPYTYWKSIAILQWQIEDIFAYSWVLCSFRRWKGIDGQMVTYFIFYQAC